MLKSYELLANILAFVMDNTFECTIVAVAIILSIAIVYRRTKR